MPLGGPRGSVLHVLLALTGYELGVLVVACVFIVFALVVALVVPRSRPDFPAKRLGLFIAVAIGLFVAPDDRSAPDGGARRS